MKHYCITLTNGKHTQKIPADALLVGKAPEHITTAVLATHIQDHTWLHLKTESGTTAIRCDHITIIAEVEAPK